MTSLPPPTTFAEGRSVVYGWLIALAGIAVGLAAVALVTIFVWGGWPVPLYGQIIGILGKALMGAIIAFLVVIIVLAIGGPINKLKLGFGKDGASVETEGDA